MPAFLSIFLFFILCLFHGQLYAVEPIARTTSNQQNNPFHELGFVSREYFTGLRGLSAACHGAYFHHYADKRANSPAGRANNPVGLYGYAQQVTRQSREQKIQLEGEVEIYYQNKRFLADRGEYDQQKSLLRLYGNLKIYDQQTSILGEQALFYTADNRITIDQAEYVLLTQGARVEFQEMEKKPNGKIHITKGRLTFCEPGNRSWNLSGSTIRLYPDKGFGEANNLVLSIADFPVFYLPYLYFPIDDKRHSGLLYPEFSSSTLNGNKYAQPIYLNLAPNYDATLVPAISNRRGFSLETEFRWLTRHTENYLIYGSIEDKSVDTSTSTSTSTQSPNRWMKRLIHRGNYRAGTLNLGTAIDYNDFSDKTYLDEVGTSFNINKQNIMPQKASFRLNHNATGRLGQNNFNSRLNAELSWINYTVLDQDASVINKPYASLPRFELNHDLIDIAEIARGKLQINNFVRYDNFVRDIASNLNTNQINAGRNLSGQRTVARPKIKLDWTTSWGYLSPEWQLHYVDYALKQQGTLESKPSRQIQTTGLSGGLFFEADHKNNLLQTLEPKFFYTNTPFIAQDGLPNFDSGATTLSFDKLFSAYRFSGFDRVGDQQKIALGITTRLLSQGRERFRFSLGQGIYLKERQVQINPSSAAEKIRNQQVRTPFATKLDYKITNYWRFNHELVYNDVTNQAERQNATFTYDKPRQHYFNLGYTETTLLRQSTLKAKSYIYTNWSLLGMVRYDLTNKNVERDAMGLEYQNCCWKIGLVVFNDYELLENNQNSKGFYLQFALRGLGSQGKSSMQINQDINTLLLK